MVNTPRLWLTVLATLVTLGYFPAIGTASNSTGGTDSYGNVISDTRRDNLRDQAVTSFEEFKSNNDIPSMREKGCVASRNCLLFGGYCVKSRKDCEGLIDSEGCEGKRCKCCLPDGCKASSKCILFGGYCVKSRKECDGMLDSKGCKGKGCKCCIPGPPCSTTSTASTTADISTTSFSTTPPGTCSFEDFNGRSIRRTVISDPKFDSYDDAISFCEEHCGAKPFIPKTEADYQLYKEVRHSLWDGNLNSGGRGYMWLPATDIQEEGVLRWYNGEVATNIDLWDWTNDDQVLALNSDFYDWLFYGHNSNTGPVVYLIYEGNFNAVYPPICENI